MFYMKILFFRAYVNDITVFAILQVANTIAIAVTAVIKSVYHSLLINEIAALKPIEGIHNHISHPKI